jgi:hypothetical protein
MSRRARRRLRRLRPLLVVLLVASGLLLLGAAVVGLEALKAKQDLVAARIDVQAARAAVTSGDQAVARAKLTSAEVRARRAHGRVTGWLWSGYAHLPAAGAPVKETRGLIDVTDAVTSKVLKPLVQAAPSSSHWDGHADLGALTRVSPSLSSADSRLTFERRRLAALPVAHVRALDDARVKLATSLGELAVDLRDAAVGAKALPALLGADHPTTLLLVAQNLAEERATGGLVGSFALVRAQEGRITLLRSGTDADLVDADRPVVDLGPDFQARYGRAEAASTWRSANLTPDVPSAGRILAGLSATQLHVNVDGVVLLDPVALSYVLRATGPVDVPGLGSLSGDNAVSLLLKDVYARYPDAGDQRARKQALRRAFDTVVVRLQKPATGGLARELVRAVSTGHVFLYAVDPSLQTELERSRIAGALPSSGPFLSVVTQDVGGSKLDYYLHRSVSYDSEPSDVAVALGAGPETVESAKITVSLRNDAPADGLPSYVTNRADDPKPRLVGQLKSWVSVYLGPRSTYSVATLDGRRLAMSSQVERGLSVFSCFVTLDPGQTVTLVLTAEQPAAPGSALLWRQQPRVAPDDLVVRQGGVSRPVARVYDLP